MSNTVSQVNRDRPLTDRQRVKIFAAARELEMDNHQLHDLVLRVTGKDSIRALTRHEGALVIDVLQDQGASVNRRRRRASSEELGSGEPSAPEAVPDDPKIIRLPTPAQMDLLVDLALELGLEPDSPYYVGILRRATRKGKILTAADASRVIDGLKAIRRRGGIPGDAA